MTFIITDCLIRYHPNKAPHLERNLADKSVTLHGILKMEDGLKAQIERCVFRQDAKVDPGKFVISPVGVKDIEQADLSWP